MALPTKPRISVLLTCFNRRDRTIRALAALFQQNGVDRTFALQVFLVDDGSTDGTGDAVRAQFPLVEVINGTGTLYWNGGMRLAHDTAMSRPFDFILWLNDDTDLHPDAISRLLTTEHGLRQGGRDRVAVFGATCDPVDGTLTYGGFDRRSGPVFRMKPVGPHPDRPREVATSAGNVLLLSADAVEAVGNLERRFFHAWGDVDYGLRLRALGGSVWLAPGFVAQCEANPNAHRWRDDPTLRLRERLQHLHSFRGLYPPDWRLFVRRHGGPTWPVAWALPYLQVCIAHVRQIRRGFRGSIGD